MNKLAAISFAFFIQSNVAFGVQDDTDDSWVHTDESGIVVASMGKDIDKFIGRLSNKEEGKLYSLDTHKQPVNEQLFDKLADGNIRKLFRRQWSLSIGNLAKSEIRVVERMIVEWKPRYLELRLNGGCAAQNKRLQEVVTILSKQKTSVKDFTVKGDVDLGSCLANCAKPDLKTYG